MSHNEVIAIAATTRHVADESRKEWRNMSYSEEIAIAATARHVADESRKEWEKYVE